MCMFHTNVDGEDVYIGNAVPPVPDLLGVEQNRAATSGGGRQIADTTDGGPRLPAPAGGRRPSGGKRTKRAAEIATILATLPDEPNEESRHYIHSDDTIDEIGANLLIWERVPMVRDTVPLKEIMEPEDWEAHERGKRSYWGVKCRCTFCGTDWDGIWNRKKKHTRILLPESQYEYYNFGIDGWDEETYEGENVLAAYDQSSVTCPCCGRWLWITNKSFLRAENRCYRLRMGTMEKRDGEWSGVFYWMAELPLDREGDGWLNIIPEAALIVTKGGELLEAAYTDGGWRRRQTRMRAMPDLNGIDRDLRNQAVREHIAPTGSKLFWSATQGKKRKDLWISWCGKDIFGNYLNADDAVGMDKTGAADGIDADTIEDEPWMLEAYLRFWAKQPRIETLARDGWKDLVRSILREEYPEIMLNWTERKPHRILGLSKEDYRATKDGYGTRWSSRSLLAWRKYNLRSKEPISAAEFVKLVEAYGAQIFRWLREAESGPSSAWDVRRMDRYIKKRDGEADHNLEMLVDYRIAANSLNALHTTRDLWPKDLQGEHDKAVASLKITGADLDTCLAFRRVQEELAPLTWTDGTYMIRAAASPAELSEEGRVLRHCVGTYAKAMAAREDVIFFVRKYRRPERSWLTLDINMAGSKPVEAALHGWFNEGTPEDPGMPNKKPKRQIPKRGRDFIDRWKREVLEPWWEATHKTMKRRKSA